MPPKCKFTKEEIVQAALEIVRESGIGSVTARDVGIKLGASSKPIFSLFRNMEELQQEVIIAAEKLYQCCLRDETKSGNFPPYKASGMGYIRFAKEEKELFKLLFMRDRSKEKKESDEAELREILQMIQQSTGFSYEKAYMFHLEMWIYVHGIATMIATAYLDWEWDTISAMLTDAYEGLKHRYKTPAKQ